MDEKNRVAFAYTSLRNDIICGRYRPGEALRQEEVASRLSISRIPIREALNRLCAEGLVVRSTYGFKVFCCTRKDLQDLIHVRLALELASLNIVIVAASRSDARALADAADTIGAGSCGLSFIESALAFHGLMHGLSGNRRMAAHICTLFVMTELLAPVKGEAKTLSTYKHHVASLVRCFQTRDRLLAAQFVESRLTSLFL